MFYFLVTVSLSSSDTFIVHYSSLALQTEWLFNNTCQYVALECFTNTNCVIFPNILGRDGSKVTSILEAGIEAHKTQSKSYLLISETQSLTVRTCFSRMFSILQNSTCSNANFICGWVLRISPRIPESGTQKARDKIKVLKQKSCVEAT